MTKLNPVEELQALDEALCRLAELRDDAGDPNISVEADILDQQWRELDDTRQRLRSRMSDRELIAYERSKNL